jgi:mRNA interferase HigB
MRIIAVQTLRKFWRDPAHADAEQPLRAWFQEAKAANWSRPADVKAQYGTASFVANNRVVFNIGGNKYRLIVEFNYPYRVGYIRFVGAHAAYDKIDAATVKLKW